MAVRISVTFHPSLDVVGGARNSGFSDVQPEVSLVAVKVKDLLFPEKAVVSPLVVSVEARVHRCQGNLRMNIDLSNITHSHHSDSLVPLLTPSHL